ncbi:ribonuclease P protein component [Acidovorax lacteus]|uniref:Uncharacterized protein n=1 Tax=Acidovorax lacteus TaxID=1924988 RepID=A0ABP8LDN6_9BURK
MQRLKTRAQFQAVMGGQTVSRTAHFALHRLDLSASVAAVDSVPPLSGPDGSPSRRASQALFGVDDVWLGAVVPKRWARRAVTRNAIKRQIYTVGAGFEAQLPGAAHVVRLRSGFDRKVFVSAVSDPLRRAVRDELLQLFGGAVRRVGRTVQPVVAVSAQEAAP